MKSCLILCCGFFWVGGLLPAAEGKSMPVDNGVVINSAPASSAREVREVDVAAIAAANLAAEERWKKFLEEEGESERLWDQAFSESMARRRGW